MTVLGDPKTVVSRAARLEQMCKMLACAEGAAEVSWWIMHQVERAVEDWPKYPHHNDEQFAEHLVGNLVASLENLLAKQSK